MASDTFARGVGVLALLVGLAAGALVLLRGRGPVSHELSILVFPAGEACKTFTTPQYERVRRNDDITWTIEDQCSSLHGAVRIDKAPVTFAGGDDKHRRGKVQDRPYNTYKYEVYLGSTLTEDPELEINR